MTESSETNVSGELSTTNGFDDMLWGDSHRVLEEATQKIQDLNKSVQKLSKLMKLKASHTESSNSTDLSYKLRNERIRARNLCKELHLELQQLSTSLPSARTLRQNFDKLNQAFHRVSERFDQLDKDSQKLVSSSIFDLHGSMHEDYDGGKKDRDQLAKQAQNIQMFGEGEVVEWEDATLDDLEKQMTELLELLSGFNELVEQQQPTIDLLEENTQQTEIRTRSAVREITKASTNKVGLVIAGAVVGGLLFGPVGALAGIKGTAALGVCTLSGAGVGAWAGMQVQEKQQQDAQQILQFQDRRDKQD